MLRPMIRFICLSALFLGAFQQKIAYSKIVVVSAQNTPEAEEQRRLSTGVKTWTGDFDEMIRRRKIRFLAPYSRTLYYIDKGRERGLTAELARDFERYINQKYKKQLKKRPITLYIIPTPRDKLIENVAKGLGDIAAGNLTITPERLQSVDFSEDKQQHGISEVVVTRKGGRKISRTEDLSGEVVYVRKSSSYYESLSNLNKILAAAKKPLVDISLLPEELEDEDIMEMVNAGLIDMTVIDDISVKLWGQILPNLDPHYDIAVRKGGHIGWAIRKNSPKLLNELQESYRKGAKKTGVIQYRYAQAMKRVKQIKNNTNREEYARFERVIKLFEKYGDRYRFDPLMLAAQGFQESQLNQNARSRSGAIGIMQVLPSTGRSLKVGDIRQIESNIHAGTKYMDILMSRYFQDSKFTDENRALFALASYNAGPGNISKMRKIATAQGLNPNVWFDNVEIVTASKIGIETTTYVRNIFKYYVSYRLIREKQERLQQQKEQFKNQN